MLNLQNLNESPSAGRDAPCAPPGHPGPAGVDSCASPAVVQGPAGPITRETLPPANTQRWVVRRKAEVLAAIDGGLLTAEEACRLYRLSPEELDLWRAAIGRAGVPGLRVTRIQLYRDVDIRRRRGSAAMVPHVAVPGFARPA
jgi:hypothetical protein